MNTGIWRGIPPLTLDGQTAFWDAQADTYETTDMTNDNQGELDIVLKKSREIRCRDVITLGGAVGCRDPKVILEDMSSRGTALPKIIFNDLAENQVRRAKEKFLKPLADNGADIAFISGAIENVCVQIPVAPRRLILGVYRDDAFFKPNSASDYPVSGYDEYLKNYAILGEEFFMCWVVLTPKNELVPADAGYARVLFDDNEERKLAVRSELETALQGMTRSGVRIAALRVIGVHSARKGFFLSHWYTSDGITELIRRVFTADCFAVDVSFCAKGMVFTIDPLDAEPTGIITILNNVVGNILPQSQYETLVAVREIMT